MLLPLLVYLQLPFFGAVWHNVVPEHDNIFLGQANAPDTVASRAQNDDSPGTCTACRLLTPFLTAVHAFNSASALQVFRITLRLSATLALVLPRGLSARVMQPALFLRDARLAPLDPPPTAVRFSA